jgi:hypothetical protein
VRFGGQRYGYKRTKGQRDAAPVHIVSLVSRLRRGRLCRLIRQGFEQHALNDRRHLAFEVELVPAHIHRGHAFAGVREQGADLFQRIAFAVEDGCRGAPQIVRTPRVHAGLCHDMPAAVGRSWRYIWKIGPVGLSARYGRISSSARPDGGVTNAALAFMRSAGNNTQGWPCALGPPRVCQPSIVIGPGIKRVSPTKPRPRAIKAAARRALRSPRTSLASDTASGRSHARAGIAHRSRKKTNLGKSRPGGLRFAIYPWCTQKPFWGTFWPEITEQCFDLLQ